MPIDIDRFENSVISEPPTSACILKFLLEHDNQAFTRREIAENIDTAPETVGTNLTRLKDRELVRHREPYWAIAEERKRVLEVLADQYNQNNVDLGTDSQQGGGPAASPHNQDSMPSTDESGDSAQSATGDDTDPTRMSHSDLHHEAASAFFERVRDEVGASIDELYLFGSVARSTASPESDVDVLAIISDEADYASIDEQLLDIAYDVQLAYGVRIEVHSIRAATFDERMQQGDPLLRRVEREGITDVQ